MNKLQMRIAKLIAMAFVLTLSGLAYGADLTGVWTFDVQTSMGPGTAVFDLKQEGDQLTGTYSGALGTAELAGSVDGDNFEWSYMLENLGEVTYSGALLEDGTVKGDADYGEMLGNATFTGARQ